MHPAATGGTATLTMACDTNCSGFDGGAGLASLEAAGPQIASHRLIDAAAIDLADAREHRRCRCLARLRAVRSQTDQRDRLVCGERPEKSSGLLSSQVLGDVSATGARGHLRSRAEARVKSDARAPAALLNRAAFDARDVDNLPCTVTFSVLRCSPLALRKRSPTVSTPPTTASPRLAFLRRQASRRLARPLQWEQASSLKGEETKTPAVSAAGASGIRRASGHHA